MWSRRVPEKHVPARQAVGAHRRRVRHGAALVPAAVAVATLLAVSTAIARTSPTAHAEEGLTCPDGTARTVLTQVRASVVTPFLAAARARGGATVTSVYTGVRGASEVRVTFDSVTERAQVRIGAAGAAPRTVEHLVGGTVLSRRAPSDGTAVQGALEHLHLAAAWVPAGGSSGTREPVSTVVAPFDGLADLAAAAGSGRGTTVGAPTASCTVDGAVLRLTTTVAAAAGSTRQVRTVWVVRVDDGGARMRTTVTETVTGGGSAPYTLVAEHDHVAQEVEVTAPEGQVGARAWRRAVMTTAWPTATRRWRAATTAAAERRSSRRARVAEVRLAAAGVAAELRALWEPERLTVRSTAVDGGAVLQVTGPGDGPPRRTCAVVRGTTVRTGPDVC